VHGATSPWRIHDSRARVDACHGAVDGCADRLWAATFADLLNPGGTDRNTCCRQLPTRPRPMPFKRIRPPSRHTPVDPTFDHSPSGGTRSDRRCRSGGFRVIGRPAHLGLLDRHCRNSTFAILSCHRRAEMDNDPQRVNRVFRVVGKDIVRSRRDKDDSGVIGRRLNGDGIHGDPGADLRRLHLLGQGSLR